MDESVYNEIDVFPAQWLRNLIAADHLPNGIVDERSIVDLEADDCAPTSHFFAGIGGWPLALRLAGWPDDRPVWTGSCPCQPFSVAGKRGGTDDPRHLWPEWFRLIRERRPGTIFGEQVASRDGYAWLDLVQADLEGCGYTVGAVVAPAAGFGAPHLRHRIYFVAQDPARVGRGGRGDGDTTRDQGTLQVARRGPTGLVADADGRDASAERLQRGGEHGQREEDGRTRGMADAERGQLERWSVGGDAQGPRGTLVGTRNDDIETIGGHGPTGLVADASGGEVGPGGQSRERAAVGKLADTEDSDGGRASGETDDRRRAAQAGGPGPTNGFWSDAEWLPCTDGKARATQPGLFPLAHGVPSRVGRLRAYGNAVCVPQAAAFVRAYLET